MTTVYAARDGVIIWNSGKMVHKQGRVPLYTPLAVRREYALSWYVLESRPAGLSLPPNALYPGYWVRRGDTILELPSDEHEPDPEPDTEPPVPADVIAAVVRILMWLKQ